MPNKPSEKNFHSIYYTPEEKSSKLGLFSATRVVLPLKFNVPKLCMKTSKYF